jgi:ARG and Rhodanese-Phosphatase-superfamily-associated Protein domain
MSTSRILRHGVCLVALVIAAGCQRAAEPAAAESAAATAPEPVRVTGPYTHENLSVFLVHSAKQDERAFITLDEGLKDGVVTVSEKAESNVRELQIDNRSDRPLFLQEGDRLQGGKQDRTIYASLVVPPQSGKMGVPTFCIEQGRWHGQAGDGMQFGATSNAALAPKEVREAAKFNKDQQGVWAAVGEQKRQAAVNINMLAGSATTSLNEVFEAPKVKEVSDAFAKALAGVLRDHADAVGVAIAVNGKIEEVNIYPNHALLSKLYPRLLQSYALQATLAKDKAKEAKPVTTAAVKDFIAEGQRKPQREEAINSENCLRVSSCPATAQATTTYKGAVVHEQVLSKSQPTAAGANPPTAPVQQAPNPPPRK